MKTFAMTRQRNLYANLALTLALVIAATASLALGTVAIPPGAIIDVLAGGGDTIHQFVIRELRLPRVLAGVLTGAAFALAGCMMQTIARNRLATPGIIGIDNAATAFAVASVVGAGLSIAPSAMALSGAAAATALAFGLAGANGTRGYRFIIAGLGIGAIAGAITQVMLSRVAIDAANAAFPWTVGSLNARSQDAVQILAIGLVIGYGLAIALGPALKTLQFSDPVAINLGTRLKRIRTLSLACAVLLTGLAVSVAGPVGMVALLAPELARALSRPGKVPLTASALAGAAFMVTADLAGRLVLSPLELPVGLVTAIAGSPYLIWILVKPSSRSLS
ncbi:ABC transporter permease [Marinobacter zhanjiangensis]|uniref:ABC transporter permease n=2 Tax=Marinobacter zhanjiangensis TaxID=578215 RepID=A0ABQ3B0Y7_9GAMM|nr:ABC transporter permease [Marinobacter zhanjiangensis]